MPRRQKTEIDPRKKPLQARSAQLVADILEAAIRVLTNEGAARFTTIRVAEAAGVSVGSLYQYFPNKQAILFRLQVDEWQRTGAVLESLLAAPERTPAERLQSVTRAFFQSECEEAPLRQALDAAAPNFADAPETLTQRTRSKRLLAKFVREAAPFATPAQRRFAAELIGLTLMSLGKQLSEQPRSPSEVDRFADATARMLTHHLGSLGPIFPDGSG
jgi:AcrR family transcriptional regulator